jgi:hypothetical protein
VTDCAEGPESLQRNDTEINTQEREDSMMMVVVLVRRMNVVRPNRRVADYKLHLCSFFPLRFILVLSSPYALLNFISSKIRRSLQSVKKVIVNAESYPFPNPDGKINSRVSSCCLRQPVQLLKMSLPRKNSSLPSIVHP